jgi:4a-hydroxytetrahydrobiopterin dehydratase
VPYPPLLAEGDIVDHLRLVPAWRREGSTIVRDLEFPSFPAAIAFVDRVARLAESHDHHPDILIRWRRVRLTLTTHARHGLTARDFELASLIGSSVDGSTDA